jgi:hypothetical protein
LLQCRHRPHSSRLRVFSIQRATEWYVHRLQNGKVDIKPEQTE